MMQRTKTLHMDIPLPEGPFKTFTADPPWPYNDKLPGGGRGAAKHYKLMTLDQIKEIGPFLQQEAEENAHLYLWTTNGFIRSAWDVAWDWGFTPKTVITWVKMVDGKVQLGLGRYFRNVTEHVIFAVKGKLFTQKRNVPTVLFAPRTQHSRKPDEFYRLVEECSPGRYLELFAREKRKGWESWGDEVPDLSLEESLRPLPDEIGRVQHISAASAVARTEKEYEG